MTALYLGIGKSISLFGNRRRGNFAVITALVLPVLIGVMGLSVDTLLLARHTNNMQIAVDSAALKAVKELKVTPGDKSHIVNIANIHTYANLQSYSKDALAVSSTLLPSTTGVKVDVEYGWKPVFAQYFDTDVTPIKVSATAELAGGSEGLTCIIGLMPKKWRTSIHMDNESILDAGDCYVQSDSSGYSIRIDASAKMSARSICAVGQIFRYGANSSFYPDPVTDCPAIGDPLIDRPQPNVGACDYSATIITEDRKLSPGVYCNGLTITDDATVKLTQGIYIIKDGPLIVADEAHMYGQGVGFFLTGDKSIFEFHENTTIELIAPTSGLLAGLLFFEDRTVPHSFDFDWTKLEEIPDDVRLHTISSNNARLLLGTVYLSKSLFLINSEAPVADNSAYTAIVAARLWLMKGPRLKLNVNYQDTDVPVPPGLFRTGDVRITK